MNNTKSWGFREKIQRSSIILLVFLLPLAAGTVQAAAPVAWVTYNDQQQGPRSSAYDTYYTLSVFGVNSGSLLDIQTGAALPVQLTITNTTGPDAAATMAEPLSGTPAYNYFYSYIDWTGGTGTAPGVHLYPTNQVGYVFTGLATNKLYKFTATAIRGAAPGDGAPNYYSNRWTQLELLGALSYTPTHSGGVITSNNFPRSLTNSQAAFNSGVNSVTGDIVQWENIVPGPAGTITVRCAKYNGLFPGGNAANGLDCYAIQALRLEQVPIRPSVSLTNPPNGRIYHWPTNVSLGASASSANGITNVQFFANGTLLGSRTAVPYTNRWASPAVGLYQLTAVAYDGMGVTATSSVVNATVDVAVTNTTPPYILSHSPSTQYLSNALTSVQVTFSRLVTGVNASDLLVNGMPATTLSGSGSNYVFGFPQPPFGTVTISWAANHGITDLAPTPHSFNATGSGATWQYITVNAIPPVVANLYPPPFMVVRSLTKISVTFSEPVAGVDSSDLLVNGQHALSVSGWGAGPYTFTFAQPPTGAVQVAWAAGNNIQDLATPPNPLPAGNWAYELDPSIPMDLAINNVIHISVDGLNAIYLQTYLSNYASQFPNFSRLAREGACTLNARCDYDNSVTVPNHSCMFTGRPVLQPAGQTNVQHGYTGDAPAAAENLQISGNNPAIYKASSFDVVHDRGLATALYASKAKFNFYVRSWNATYGAQDLLPPDNGRNKIDFSMLNEANTNLYGCSEALVDALLIRMTNAPSAYTFLHFAETDYAGHNTGWGSASWMDAVQHVDGQLGRILNFIDTHPGLSNQFGIVLTADHGGGGGSSTGHSVPSNVLNYTIPMFVWMPGMPAGVDLYSLMANRGNPGTNYLDYIVAAQPLRNGDSGNLAVAMLGFPAISGSLMKPNMYIGPATLNLVQANSVMKVSWPAGLGGYQLECCTNLAGQVAWQPVTSGITTNGAMKIYSFTNSPARPPQFFHLKKS